MLQPPSTPAEATTHTMPHTDQPRPDHTVASQLPHSMVATDTVVTTDMEATVMEVMDMVAMDTLTVATEHPATVATATELGSCKSLIHQQPYMRVNMGPTISSEQE